MQNKNRLELAHIMESGFAAYCHKQGPLPREHYKVVNAITACRTAELGGHIYRCDECGHEHIAYNSCRNRHCPKCQALARAKWVQERMEELLAVDYFHVVFTIPQQLNPFALRNKAAFYRLLFCAVSETLLELGKNPKWIGGEIGFIAILHTWGQNLMDHPHIHCVVPAGGLVKNGKEWKHGRKGFLFPVKVMAKLFKGKFLDYFKTAVQKKEIEFHGTLKVYSDTEAFDSFLHNLYETDWIVYVKPPFGSPEAVLKYLGRYTHRIAISNQRLVKMENGNVTFTYKDYADGNKRKNMTLKTSEFIRRFLLHVVPDGFMRIRHYGFLGNHCRSKKLALCRKLLGGKPYRKKDKAEAEKWYEIILSLTGNDPTVCPLCRKGHLKPFKEIPKPLKEQDMMLAA